MTTLDKISKRILVELQANGRMSNVELASKVNLSPAACLDRVRKLHDTEYILGYAAMLNPERLNASLMVFIEVTLDRTTPDVFETFRSYIKGIPEIQECYLVAGGIDFLVKARVKDMKAYSLFLGRTLLQLSGVRETHTFAVMEEIKNTRQLPV